MFVKIGEDKASEGFLGAIGLGKKSPYSIKSGAMCYIVSTKQDSYFNPCNKWFIVYHGGFKAEKFHRFFVDFVQPQKFHT